MCVYVFVCMCVCVCVFFFDIITPPRSFLNFLQFYLDRLGIRVVWIKLKYFFFFVADDSCPTETNYDDDYCYDLLDCYCPCYDCGYDDDPCAYQASRNQRPIQLHVDA